MNMRIFMYIYRFVFFFYLDLVFFVIYWSDYGKFFFFFFGKLFFFLVIIFGFVYMYKVFYRNFFIVVIK